MAGHWAGYFIKGAGYQPSVGVLGECNSRFVLLSRMDDTIAAAAVLGFTAKLNLITAPLRLSLTYDRGEEMAKQAELTEQTGFKVYFCDYHIAWQWDSCENTIVLLRQFLLKRTDLSVPSQVDLKAIAEKFNQWYRVAPDFCPPRLRSLDESLRPLLGPQFNSIEPGLAFGT